MKISLRTLALVVAIGGVVVLVLAFWRQQSELTRMRDAFDKLAAQNAELAKGSSSSQGGTQFANTPKVAPTAIPAGQTETAAQSPENASGEMEVSESIPKGKGLKPWQKESQKQEPPPLAADRLILGETSVKPVADGLVATMKFSSISNNASEKLALVFRLDKRSDARILNVDPADPDNYTDVAKRVSENGKFAIFTGSIKNAGNVSFNLSLSGPDTVDVRGSCGITPILLEVTASGASVRNFSVR